MSCPASPPAIQISGPEGRMDNYIRAVERAGGAPVPGYAPEPDSHCLGLVLCGGGRDAAELALVRTWLSWGRPILGICRGMQVINVALGGTLFQDLGAERAALHQGEEDVFHPVRTAPGSLLEGLFGENALVNSAHHQGVDRLGEGLVPAAWAPDGTLEGLEHRSLPVAGVQFHPERLPNGGGDGLFRWLMERAVQR